MLCAPSETFQNYSAPLKLALQKQNLTGGPSNRKMNLVGTGTSVRSPKCRAVFNLTKIEIGLCRQFSSPTRMLLASASLGSFFMKCKFEAEAVEAGET